MSDLREPASTNLPEWRRTATPSGNSLTTKSFARRPKIVARWKDHGFIRELPRDVQERSSWVIPTGPCPEISLESLGSDLWFLISSYAPKSELLSICQTSPSLHAQVIPVLYHAIDLSTHTPLDGITISFRHRRRIYERQYMFMRQITRKPEYGQYVRSLKWTVGVENEQVWSVALDESGFRAPTSLAGERVVWSSGNVGKVFERLTQVTSLDIEGPNRIGEMVPAAGDKVLFPAVQRVKLGSTSNAHALLFGAGNAPLSFLQIGPYAVARPDPSGLTTRNASLSNSNDQNFKKYPDLLRPSFQLRCKNLHTLSVTIQHLDTLSDARFEVRAFYTSLATFLLSIRPRSFIFNLVGMNGRPLPQPMSSPHVQHQSPSCPRCHGPMAADASGRLSHISGMTMANVIPQLFQDILLPVLVKGWDGLQRVEIRGVMKRLLWEMKTELGGKGVVLAGDGWEEEWVNDDVMA